ncbi:hypothetical protein [Desulfolucanica intricata]|uniref:hypothetical protein n=1 Tax=Desulfolucanica intricata TaxID=1285191 RepID=UPI0008365EB7|nr:hypothetical protein [Desulfolucanica intricata]
MKNIGLIKSIINIDKQKKHELIQTIDNISFAATVGFMSGAIYGIEYYFGSLTTGVIGLFIGGLAGYTFDRVLPLK